MSVKISSRFTESAWWIGLSLISLILGYVFSVGPFANVAEVVRLPLEGDGDSFGVFAVVKSLSEFDWFPFFGIKTARLGAPFGFTMHDYPHTDGIFHAILWLVALVCRDAVVTVNVFFFLSFPLNAAAMKWLLRSEGVGRPLASGLALIYTLLPFHFYRYNHVFYMCYFYVPLICAYLLRVWRRMEHGDARFDRWDLISAFFIASCGFYQSFFVLFALGVLGVCTRTFGQWLRPAFAILGCTVVQILPTIVHWIGHGGNAAIAVRSPGEAELFSLKLVNLLLPARNSVIPFLAKLREHYESMTPPVEGFYESVGVLGAVGLTLSIISVLRPPVKSTGDIQRFCGVLVLGFILLGTFGGYGDLLAQFGFTKIRSYNRVSIWMITLIYLYVGLVMKDGLRRYRGRATSVVAVVIILFGVVELTPKRAYLRDWQKFDTTDATFYHELEAALPHASAVLQLPFSFYPETALVERMSSYEPLQAMVYTEHLKFSFGLMPGRPEGERVRQLSDPEIDLRAIRELGYKAIYLDRFGYKDGGESVIQKILAEVPDAKTLFSQNNRRVAILLPETPRASQ